nr:MAG: hypothetical protein DIU68_10295 [Chloroflexota bacterium]
MRQRICIIGYSPIHRDARILRQIEYLSPDYDLTVIAHGEPVAAFPDVTWRFVPRANRFENLLTLVFLAAARLLPFLYETWYWQKRRNRLALRYAIESRPNAIHANDWSALPAAVEAARQTEAKVVLDLHEYAPRQSSDWWWVLLFAPAIWYLLRKYAPQVDASMTVCSPIAEAYRRDFGLDPIVVMNAPRFTAVDGERHATDGACIRLIHHGAAARQRGLEVMIDAVALAGVRFRLDFMLVPTDRAYLEELKQRARRLAPDRVHFLDPVPPTAINRTLATYDISLTVIQPRNFNYLVALPNKFFDAVVAGLAVVIGPSPALAELGGTNGFGVVAPSFEAQDIAATLNRLTVEQIEEMRQRARKAAETLNADREMTKVAALYTRLLNQQDR